MSQLLRREPSSAPRAPQSLGLGTTTACWSPLAEREHRVVCTTSEIEGAVPPHMHAQHHVGVVERGTATLRSEGRRWTIGPGDLIWNVPRQIHSISSEYCRCRWIAVDEHSVERIASLSGLSVPEETRVFTDASRAAELLELHQRLENGAVTQPAASTLANVIAALARAPANGALLPPSLTTELEECRLAIRKRYADGLRLTDLAAIAGMSLFHLARTFARVLGVPPHTYLLHLRVAWAQSLLRRGLAGSRVAYEVGFSDQSHCIRVHHRFLGVSPFAVLSLERTLPVMAAGFAELPEAVRRAITSIWLP